MERIFSFKISRDDSKKNCKKKDITVSFFDILVKNSVKIFEDILMVLDDTNTEIQRFISEKEFCIFMIEYQKIKLLFSVKSLHYQEEEHLLIYLDKNCFGYYNELYNCDIVQKENMYLMYNYGFFRNELTVCQKYFEKETLVEKIMDEIMLCGSSLYE